MKKPEKKHDTGLRILEVLKILLDEDLTKNQLIEYLKFNKDVEGVYTKEAFLKYFNTFELLGLKLKKDKTKYGFSTAILKVDLTKEEKEALVSLVKFINKYNDKSSEALLNRLFLRLEKFVGVNIEDILRESNQQLELQSDNIRQNIIKTLKDMIYEKQQVDITYKKNDLSEETDTFELKEIIEKDGKTYISCCNSKTTRNKKICVDLITGLKQQHGKNKEFDMKTTVTFEIYGRLIQAYKLKENEKGLDFYPNKLVISNTNEDKDALLLRLLKYGENCKILKPESLKNEFLMITNQIIKNLESYKCQQ